MKILLYKVEAFFIFRKISCIAIQKNTRLVQGEVYEINENEIS